MMAETVESNPNAPMVVLVGGAVRAILAILGGFGIAWAEGVTGNQVTLIASTLVALAAIGWSIYQKIYAAWREHQIAVMSAKGGKAVQPERVMP